MSRWQRIGDWLKLAVAAVIAIGLLVLSVQLHALRGDLRRLEQQLQSPPVAEPPSAWQI